MRGLQQRGGAWVSMPLRIQANPPEQLRGISGKELLIGRYGSKQMGTGATVNRQLGRRQLLGTMYTLRLDQAGHKLVVVRQHIPPVMLRVGLGKEVVGVGRKAGGC